MKKFLFALFLFPAVAMAQPAAYTVANVHSHNDYEQAIPFHLAYDAGLGSIEADIFLVNGELIVAHSPDELPLHRTLEDLYLKNLEAAISKNNGHPYADTARFLQILVDIKSDSVQTLARLVDVLRNHPALIRCPQLRFVISGNRPAPPHFGDYPDFIWFDGILSARYDAAALRKIAMLSDDFAEYSHWNGKGIVPAPEWEKLEAAVRTAHAAGKTVRFWDAPDFLNAWYQFMRLGVDYINTDSIARIAKFMSALPSTRAYGVQPVHPAYRPTYASDDRSEAPRNVILLIGDGTGLAQMFAGYTANHGALSLFAMRQIGLSKTQSADSYVTDSAPGATAFSAGVKANNRAVGVDHTGRAVPLLPEFMARLGKKTGLVTCGDITDATPAAFYAHQTERDRSDAILRDLLNAPVDYLFGSGEVTETVAILRSADRVHVTDTTRALLAKKFHIAGSLDQVSPSAGGRWIVADSVAAKHRDEGRGDWLPRALDKTMGLLDRNRSGFFLMTEGAQVDHGGHANNLSWLAAEMMDFDEAIGRALAFADRDGHTLVIVTADHETGGLSLLDGDFRRGYVAGQFTTNDHTGIPVPVFAYGPRSGLFRGVYENTEIFDRIRKALK